jgi:hypothetical protein
VRFRKQGCARNEYGDDGGERKKLLHGIAPREFEASSLLRASALCASFTALLLSSICGPSRGAASNEGDRDRSELLSKSRRKPAERSALPTLSQARLQQTRMPCHSCASKVEHLFDRSSA